MKRFLLVVAVLCLATSAFAGPNEAGTLVVHDKALRVSATIGTIPICPQGNQLTTCSAADVRIDGADSGADPALFEVYAAFCSHASPRVKSVVWGIHYSDVHLSAAWSCADFQLPDDGSWPSSDSGISCSWNAVQTGHLIPLYVFAAYAYGWPTTFDLVADPAQGVGRFADDSVPALLDDIAGYSKMGFDGPGIVACTYCSYPPGACCDPATGICTFIESVDCSGIFHSGTDCTTYQCPPPPDRACCDPATSDCTLTIQVACPSPLIWHAEIATCTPNDCPIPVPVERTSWGRIKNLYR